MIARWYRSAPLAVLMLLVAHSTRATEPPAPPAPAGSPSATEINERVINPVTTTWSSKLQDNIYLLDFGAHGNQAKEDLTLQPTMPVWLTKDLKLISIEHDPPVRAHCNGVLRGADDGV